MDEEINSALCRLDMGPAGARVTRMNERHSREIEPIADRAVECVDDRERGDLDAAPLIDYLRFAKVELVHVELKALLAVNPSRGLAVPVARLANRPHKVARAIFWLRSAGSPHLDGADPPHLAVTAKQRNDVGRGGINRTLRESLQNPRCPADECPCSLLSLACATSSL